MIVKMDLGASRATGRTEQTTMQDGSHDLPSPAEDKCEKRQMNVFSQPFVFTSKNLTPAAQHGICAPTDRLLDSLMNTTHDRQRKQTPG